MTQAISYNGFSMINILVIAQLFIGVFARNQTITSTAASNQNQIVVGNEGELAITDWMISTIIIAGTVIVFWALCLCVLGACLCAIYFTNRKKLQSHNFNHFNQATNNTNNNNNNSDNKQISIFPLNLKPRLQFNKISKSELQTSTNKSHDTPLPDPDIENSLDIVTHEHDPDNDNSNTSNIPSHPSSVLNNNSPTADDRHIADTTIDLNVYPSYNYITSTPSAPETRTDENLIQFTLNQSKKSSKMEENDTNDGENDIAANPTIHQLTPSQVIQLREYMFAQDSNRTATTMVTATANETSSPQESTTINTWKIIAQTDGLETGQLNDIINEFEAEQEAASSDISRTKAPVLAIINHTLCAVKDTPKTDGHGTPPIVAITPRNFVLEPVDDNKEDMVFGETDIDDDRTVTMHHGHHGIDGYLDTRYLNVEESNDGDVERMNSNSKSKSPTETTYNTHYKVGRGGRHTIMSDHGKYPSIPSTIVIHVYGHSSNGKGPSIYGPNGYPLDSITPDGGSKGGGSVITGGSAHGHNHPVILLSDRSPFARSVGYQLPKYHAQVNKLSKI